MMTTSLTQQNTFAFCVTFALLIGRGQVRLPSSLDSCVCVCQGGDEAVRHGVCNLCHSSDQRIWYDDSYYWNVPDDQDASGSGDSDSDDEGDSSDGECESDDAGDCESGAGAGSYTGDDGDGGDGGDDYEGED